MVTSLQVVLPLAVLTLIAGGSLVFWALLFRKAAREDS